MEERVDIEEQQQQEQEQEQQRELETTSSLAYLLGELTILDELIDNLQNRRREELLKLKNNLEQTLKTTKEV